MRPVEHNSVERASDEIGDAEGGQAHTVEPLLSALAVQVVPHCRQDDAVLDPAGQKEAGHDESSTPFLSSL